MDSLSSEILVIDDDPISRTIIGFVVERLGCRVVYAEDGTEAISKLKERKFSAILLDLLMPGEDGFAVLEYLQQSQPSHLKKVIVMTALHDKYLSSLRRDDVFAVVQKPIFDRQSFVDVVVACTNQAPGPRP